MALYCRHRVYITTIISTFYGQITLDILQKYPIGTKVNVLRHHKCIITTLQIIIEAIEANNFRIPVYYVLVLGMSRDVRDQNLLSTVQVPVQLVVPIQVDESAKNRRESRRNRE